MWWLWVILPIFAPTCQEITAALLTLKVTWAIINKVKKNLEKGFKNEADRGKKSE